MEEERSESQVEEQQEATEQKGTVEEKKQDDDQKQKSKKGRIIIRNLVFDIRDTHIRKLASKFGELVDVNVPINPATNKAKGFAFVEFDNKNTALKAIKELNGTQYKGRTIAVDLAVDKGKFEAFKNPIKEEAKKNNNAKENKRKTFEEEDSEGEIEKEDDEDEEIEEDEEDYEDEEDDEEDGDEEDDEEEEEEKEEVKPKTQMRNKNEDFSCTIFIRNISYDVGQSEFRDFFKQFGDLDYAKLVINRETETHNGNGFVKFKSAETAKYLIEQSKKLEDSNPFKKDSTVTSISLELGGRRMVVLPALNRNDVTKLKESRDKEFEAGAPKNKNSLEYWIYQDKNKKRMLYLMTLGLNDPEQVHTEFDKEKFTANLNEKIEKAKNPNYFVSKTRVIFKNLPKRDFEEDDLKKVILDILGQKHNAKIIKTRRLVSKINIIREKDRADEEGNLRSRGYGFAEFENHEDALYFLEQIQEHYGAISKNRVPIVEFALEDVREIQKREKILQKIKNKKSEGDDKEKEKEKGPKKVDSEKKNSEKLAKLKLDQLLQQEGKGVLSEIKAQLKKIHSRGIKQRYKKRIAAKFKIEEPEKKKQQVEKPKPSKLQAKVQQREKVKNQRNEEAAQKAVKPSAKSQKSARAEDIEIKGKHFKGDDLLNMNADDELNLIKGLQKIIKNKKTTKRRAADHDEFDDMADAYKRKIQKV